MFALLSSCQALPCSRVDAPGRSSGQPRAAWASLGCWAAEPKASSSADGSRCEESWKQELAPVFPWELLLSYTAPPVCLWTWPLAVILTQGCHPPGSLLERPQLPLATEWHLVPGSLSLAEQPTLLHPVSKGEFCEVEQQTCTHTPSGAQDLHKSTVCHSDGLQSFQGDVSP